MTRKLIGRMLAAQILSALTVSVCLLIDNVMINRFLGVEAVAAYELANPVLLAIGAVASVLCAGVQVACSRSLGAGSQEETNRGYSTALAIVFAVSLPFLALILLLKQPIALLLGAGRSPELLRHTTDYLAGFVLGAPATMAALSLIPFLQIAGKSTLLIAAVLGMTVSDVALDLLNVLVFHGGMFGMGLASTLSYYIALGIALCYFLSKKCIFRFSRKGVSRKKAAELFRGGAPGAFTMVSGVLIVLTMNFLMMRTGGSEAVAAFAIVSGILNAANSVSTGFNGVTLTLTGVLFSEEDRFGLQKLLKHLMQFAVVAGPLFSAALFLAAPAAVGLFLKDPGPLKDMTVYGVRLTALGLFPCCLVNIAKSYYQGTERIPHLAVISVLESFLLPALCAWILSLLRGMNGIWLYFAAGQTLTVLLIFIYGLIQYRNGKNPILLPSFGYRPENAMEMRITSLEQVMEASRQAESFCAAHGCGARFASRIALCIEEMAGNTVLHGFKPGAGNYLSVRVQCRENRWILRFRDDCRAFDPVSRVPQEDRTDCLGIRVVLGMADDVRYTYSLNLNNLTILLTAPQGGVEPAASAEPDPVPGS